MSTDHGAAGIWLVIGAIALATYAIRLSFIYLFGRIDEVPPRVEHALRFVPPAVLAALTVPAIVTIQPTVPATVLDDRFIAGAVAFVVAWRTENIFATITAGMVALWVVRFLLL